MNVKQLKILLENVNDDVVLVVPGSDHSFREVRACLDKAEKSCGYYSEVDPTHVGDGSIVSVLVFGG